MTLGGTSRRLDFPNPLARACYVVSVVGPLTAIRIANLPCGQLTALPVVPITMSWIGAVGAVGIAVNIVLSLLLVSRTRPAQVVMVLLTIGTFALVALNGWVLYVLYADSLMPFASCGVGR